MRTSSHGIDSAQPFSSAKTRHGASQAAHWECGHVISQGRGYASQEAPPPGVSGEIEERCRTMAKPPPKKPDSLKAAFEPEAWEKFESLAKAAARERAYAQPSETPSKQRKGLRSAPLT